MNFIVDDIGTVVAAMRPFGTINPTLTPYYMYGHREEIANRLKEKENDAVFKYQKYPLVALRLDVAESVHDGLIDFTLNVAIVAFTSKTDDAEKRYQNVFKPVLYPLYESFLKQLKLSGLFMFGKGLSVPSHTKIDRPFWGIPAVEGNVKYIFNDPLDAIELTNLKLTQPIKKC